MDIVSDFMDEFQGGGRDHYLGTAPLKFMFPLTVHVIQQNASCFVWKVSITKLGADSLRVVFRFSHKKKVMPIGLPDRCSLGGVRG
jgi:hypothetical protein